MWAAKPRCSACGRESDAPGLWCPACQGLMRCAPIASPRAAPPALSSMWDLQPFLPQFTNPISLREGATPVMPLANIPALRKFWVKLEFRNPTGSFRDRASSLVVSHALQQGKTMIVGADTGSFCISLAAYAAHASLRLKNVVPQNLELSKIEQMKVYGSEVIQVGESVEEALQQAHDIAKQEGGYTPTPDANILTIEGQKTIGLELALQQPNVAAIVVPRGSGSLVLSIYSGLKDALASGWIQAIPVFYSVALEHARVSHVAESLEIHGSPLQAKVDEILHETGGREIQIGAGQMLEDALELAQKEGHFVEPASASVISAAKHLLHEGAIQPSTTAGILTGTGINALNVFAAHMRGIKKVVWGLSPSTTSKFEILNLIASGKAVYGYAIWGALGKVHSIQSIYQHLAELEKRALISGDLSGQKKKKYAITPKGVETLEKMRDLVDYV